MMQNLTTIPGVGKSIAKNLEDIGIKTVGDLKGKNPEKLFELSNKRAGKTQDRCLLYVFREAVYFASGGRDPEKLKWWNWKDCIRTTKTGCQNPHTHQNPHAQ